jgi:hypothetical protein
VKVTDLASARNLRDTDSVSRQRPKLNSLSTLIRHAHRELFPDSPNLGPEDVRTRRASPAAGHSLGRVMQYGRMDAGHSRFRTWT